MFPRIATFKTPDFLRGLLPDQLVINSYGFCIALGIIFSFFIILHRNKKLGLDLDKLSELFLWCFASAFVGGKLFFFLENPSRYFLKPALMLEDVGSGFVFYGSLLLVVPTMYFWLRKRKIPFLPFMDGVAFGGPVLHSFGRLGCFLAGCCHGKVCNNFLGVVFSHPDTAASPRNVPLYPTQLFEIAVNLVALGIIFLVSKRQKFRGQLFLIYIALYAAGRIVIENFRGDEERGYFFGGLLSHSQTIALGMILCSGVVWFILARREKINKQP